MSRKPTLFSRVAVVSVRENTAIETTALDEMTRAIYPIKGRGRRMQEEAASRLGDLVTALSSIKAAGGDVPLQYLTSAHLKNPNLVAALLALGVSDTAFLSVSEDHALRSGIELTVEARQQLSNAAAHYLRQANRCL